MEGPGRRPGVCKSRIAYAGRAKSTHDSASPPPATVLGWVVLPPGRRRIVGAPRVRPAPHVNVEYPVRFAGTGYGWLIPQDFVREKITVAPAVSL